MSKFALAAVGRLSLSTSTFFLFFFFFFGYEKTGRQMENSDLTKTTCRTNKGALKKFAPSATKKKVFCGCWCNFFLWLLVQFFFFQRPLDKPARNVVKSFSKRTRMHYGAERAAGASMARAVWVKGRVVGCMPLSGIDHIQQRQRSVTGQEAAAWLVLIEVDVFLRTSSFSLQR